MANEIIFPHITPLKFTKMNQQDIPQYVSRFMDQYLFRETIKSYEQYVCFFQPWQLSDAVRMQVISNYGPVSMQLYTINGVAVGDPVVYANFQQDYFRPGFYLRQCDVDLEDYDAGIYYWVLSAGSDKFVSEPQEFLEEAPNTLYAEYSHPERYGEVIFQSPYQPALRIPAVLKFLAPGSKDTIYEDQVLNQTMLIAQPYRRWELIIGDARGLPPWFIDKINWILGCQSIKLDGRSFTKSEGAELEINETDLYPMAGYRIEMRERYNRAYTEYENSTIVTGINNMIAVIDSKGFGEEGQFLEIENIE